MVWAARALASPPVSKRRTEIERAGVPVSEPRFRGGMEGPLLLIEGRVENETAFRVPSGSSQSSWTPSVLCTTWLRVSSTSTTPERRSRPGRTIARLSLCSHAQAV